MGAYFQNFVPTHFLPCLLSRILFLGRENALKTLSGVDEKYQHTHCTLIRNLQVEPLCPGKWPDSL
jgi:hypothetical protein